MSLSFWGLTVTLAVYTLAALLYRRFALAIFHPILLGTVVLMIFLAVSGIPRETYSLSVEPLARLMLPATVCLAIPVYKQFHLLRKYLLPVLAGVLAGVFTAMGGALLIVRLCGLSQVWLATFLPKSTTSAFGMALAGEYGGIPAMATAIIVLTGLFGGITCKKICKTFGITHPVAMGLAIGSASHAFGTTQALAIGETEGAMASLAMMLTGLATTALMPLFLLCA